MTSTYAITADMGLKFLPIESENAHMTVWATTHVAVDHSPVLQALKLDATKRCASVPSVLNKPAVAPAQSSRMTNTHTAKRDFQGRPRVKQNTSTVRRCEQFPWHFRFRQLSDREPSED